MSDFWGFVILLLLMNVLVKLFEIIKLLTQLTSKPMKKAKCEHNEEPLNCEKCHPERCEKKISWEEEFDALFDGKYNIDYVKEDVKQFIFQLITQKAKEIEGKKTNLEFADDYDGQKVFNAGLQKAIEILLK